jgi:AcrR family transcriptional regulator
MAMTIVDTGRRKRGRPPRGQAADRGQILRVALATFAREGFDGTNLRSIAAGAGVDVALVSRHFGPKLDLWKAVVDEIAGRMAGAQADIVALHDGDGPVEERIRIALRQFVAFSCDIPELGRFFANEISRPGERCAYVLERIWRPHRETLLPLLEEGGEAGVIPRGDPELLLAMLIGAVAMPLMMPPASRSRGRRPVASRDFPKPLSPSSRARETGRRRGRSLGRAGKIA